MHFWTDLVLRFWVDGQAWYRRLSDQLEFSCLLDQLFLLVDCVVSRLLLGQIRWT